MLGSKGELAQVVLSHVSAIVLLRDGKLKEAFQCQVTSIEAFLVYFMASTDNWALPILRVLTTGAH